MRVLRFAKEVTNAAVELLAYLAFIYAIVLALSGIGVVIGAVLSAEQVRQTPDSKLTPGVVRPLTKTEVCATAWGKDRRHVTESMKRQVATAYGVPWANHAAYEFDHLIPRELGGADDVRNLWPESWTSQPLNAHRKDQLENRLHVLVCAGSLSLPAAQEAVRTNWPDAYKRFVVRKEAR